MPKSNGVQEKTQKLIDFANDVSTPSRPMTLRQIYYACVTNGVLSSGQASYIRLKVALTNARRSGEFPYESMVDGLREAQVTAKWNSVADRADTAKFIHLDPWQSQEVHVEIVLEKDAILRLIESECTEQDVTIRTFRGDPSLSFLYATAKDYAALIGQDKKIRIGYLGDHDGGGINICRSAERGIREILKQEFFIELYDCDDAFQWVRLGVNFEDFEAFNLLPIPGKMADTKLKAYQEEFGISYGCELDALPLDEVVRRVHDFIEEAKDQKVWDKAKEFHLAEEQRWQSALESVSL